MVKLSEHLNSLLDLDEETERPSKTQKKKAAHNLQKIGEFLVKMPKSEIEKLDISQELKDTIKMAKGITQHGAKKRQMQYIGVLMRELDITVLNQIMEKIPHSNRF